MKTLSSASGLADEEEGIVRGARDGDPQCLALLLESHYPDMLATATRIMGAVPDAQDACQDAAITATARIGELRDPGAVRGWLHAIVRNKCRTMLAARKPVPVGVAGLHLPAAELDDPAARIERRAQQDWVRHGLQQLTPAVQPVAMLRYFTETNSYEEIATLCGVPVGTVRSRLSEARRQLAAILPHVRDAPHGTAGKLTAERREEARAILSAVPSGARLEQVLDRWADDVVMHWPQGGLTTSRAQIFAAWGRDYDGGVTYQLTGLVAGAGITIWENRFVNPPEDPDHCPPGGTWLLREREGRVSEIRLLHAPRTALRDHGRQPGDRPADVGRPPA